MNGWKENPKTSSAEVKTLFSLKTLWLMEILEKNISLCCKSSVFWMIKHLLFLLISIVTCCLKMWQGKKVDKDRTCSCIEFGAVPIINIFLSDVKLWQSDGVHLHRVPCLPHKLQVVCGVANWMKETHRKCPQMPVQSTPISTFTNRNIQSEYRYMI